MAKATGRKNNFVSKKVFPKINNIEFEKFQSDEMLRSWYQIARIPEKFVLECFPPIGIRILLRQHFLWWGFPWDDCCCCCCDTGDSKYLPSVSTPVSQATSSLTIVLNLKQDTFGPGKAIHVIGVPQVGTYPAQYVAEWFMQWNASGGEGQLTVELEVKRPNSANFEKLVSGRGPSDSYLFGTHQSGDYLFKATVKDSRGNAMFATSSVTAPRIPGIGL